MNVATILWANGNPKDPAQLEQALKEAAKEVVMEWGLAVLLKGLNLLEGLNKPGGIQLNFFDIRLEKISQKDSALGTCDGKTMIIDRDYFTKAIQHGHEYLKLHILLTRHLGEVPPSERAKVCSLAASEQKRLDGQLDEFIFVVLHEGTHIVWSTFRLTDQQKLEFMSKQEKRALLIQLILKNMSVEAMANLIPFIVTDASASDVTKKLKIFKEHLVEVMKGTLERESLTDDLNDLIGGCGYVAGCEAYLEFLKLDAASKDRVRQTISDMLVKRDRESASSLFRGLSPTYAQFEAVVPEMVNSLE